MAVQMGVFKASGRKKRLFRMSPIHHHFELLGWPETTVIIRFWLIAGICVATALAIFIGDFTRLESLPMSRTVHCVYGIAITGEAVARALVGPRSHGRARPTTSVNAAQARAGRRARRRTRSRPRRRGTIERAGARRSIWWCRRRVCPRPTRSSTPRSSAGVPVRTEIDLAYEWEQERPGGPRPMIGITGTDGKTTTTLMVAAMLAGRRHARRRGGQHRGAAGRRARRTGRRVRGRVQQLPAGLRPLVPHRGRHLAEPRTRPPELARLDGQLPTRPRPASGSCSAPTDVAVGWAGDAVGDARARRRPGAPRHLRAATAATTASTPHDDGSAPRCAAAWAVRQRARR